MSRVLLAVLVLLAAMSAGPRAMAQMLSFADLDGWDTDDHRAALTSFTVTCDKLDDSDWQPICRLARDIDPEDDLAARSFFELLFRPVIIGAPPALFTGYYEPELRGSPVRTPRYAWPVYRRPPELRDGVQWYSRQDIESRGLLAGRGLELAWVEDPVDLFFLQIQGSGRIRMPDGKVMRVGYAGQNGFPYRSVGQELVRRGVFTIDEVSAQQIRAWVKRNGAAGTALLHQNPSYVFFRKIADLPADKGPIGAMGRSITTLRSVAVDPKFTPLGAPVWIEKDGAAPLRKLMVAQDTGGAIKGPQRADIFYGSGDAAGDAAGTVKDGGRMVVLLPIDRAYAMLPEG